MGYEAVRKIYNRIGEKETRKIIDFEEETIEGFKGKYYSRAGNYIERKRYGAPKGYSLKYRRLQYWKHKNGYSYKEIAQYLGLTTELLMKKLYYRKRFAPKQIKYLVYLLGARAAFRVIYFPMYKGSKRIYRETFEVKNE